MLFEEAGEADALAAEELGGEHRVENAFRAEAAEVVEEAEIEIAAVHHEVFFREDLEEWLDFQAGSEDIDEEDLTIDQELEEADAGLVVIHVVRLGIEGDFVHAVEGLEQRSKRAGLIDEGITGRPGGLGRGPGSGGFDAEEAANGGRQETGNHLDCGKSVGGGTVESESGNCGGPGSAQIVGQTGAAAADQALRKASMSNGRCEP